MKKYYAHSGQKADRSDWHLLSEHLEGTAKLASLRGKAMGLRAAAEMAGRYHDFGKYDPQFDRILCGEKIKVEHSTAGAKLLLDRAPGSLKLCAEILAYTILGHHAGLPDRTNGTNACLDYRIGAFRDPIAPEITAAATFDLTPIAQELMAHMRRGAMAGFDLSVCTRMIFSCLIDADYRDTEAFYDRIEARQRDRDWPALPDILPSLLEAFDTYMGRFEANSDLNRTRREILAHVRNRASMTPGLFTLSVPTGGGKTLASMGFALDHAARHGHRRIIYAIPYTSIIDQTAKIFRELFGPDIVLEHHAAIDIEKPGSEQRDKLKLAMEDWAAPIIVTTNVQLFESLFAARPSRCRKLHNIAGSIIVLDEAQCLPRKLLMPALRMIDALATHYNCTVILCTATQPVFDSAQLKPGGLPLAGRELAPDPKALSQRLRRAQIVPGGEMDDQALITALDATPQGLVIVNSRAHALDLFKAGKAHGLEGMIHLTTRQYPAHRRRIIAEIRRRLQAGEACRLIATSLIEAGVDLDFPIGWRAEAGLDSCIQAAGRINREGRRLKQDSMLTIFSAPGRNMPPEVKSLAEAMRNTSKRYEDLLSAEAIHDWFEHVYWKAGPERLGQKMVESFILARSGSDFPFRRIADEFRMIEDAMLPIVIARDADAQNAIRKLTVPAIPSATIARELQLHTVQIPARDRALLVKNGQARFYAPDSRGDQFCILENKALYHEDSGLRWEDAESLAPEIQQI